MSVTLLSGHVSRARDFYNKTDIYFGIGKTTSWAPDSDMPNTDATTSDTNPPVPLNTDTLLEPAGYKKVESKFLVVPDDENGQLSYQNKKWRIVPYDDAVKEGARWVYISVNLMYNEIPTDISYRQVEIFSGLKAKNPDENKYVLLPDEVADQGIGEALDNRTPIYREADQKEKLSIVIEF